MTFTIKKKLLFIGVLFLFAIGSTEMFSSYNAYQTDVALKLMDNRGEQVELLNELEVALVEFTLAGMDAIIDKDSGEVAPELKEEMTSASTLWRDNLGNLESVADTDKEKALIKNIITVYPQLESAVMVDLPKLIRDKADKTAFDAMDDKIDGLLTSVDEPLMAVIASVGEENHEAYEELLAQISFAKNVRRIFATVMLVVIGGVLVIVGRSILQPIEAAVTMIQDVAEGEGDLTKRLAAGDDEIGQLANWFNVFMERLHGIISQVQSNLETLNSASTDLSTLSETLASGSEDATSRSNTVATATEQMSGNMNAVAAASEQASVNVNMVSAAAEEMNATVNEIAGNTARARQIAEEAVTNTDRASQQVDELGNAAEEISKVTEVITEISEQTNLLALNATIEAARAGEAGKGFAVVANEIKELAKQTAQATFEIRQKIEAIQSSTGLTITEISEISSTINDVNEIVATIATAVEEQSASTSEIAGNISQASLGINEVNENVSQTSTVSSNIAEEIVGVSQVAEQLKHDSDRVNSQSSDLSDLAEELSSIVNQFKLK